ncbi:MAG TPA: exonuclease SbcCD subunit D [Nakamurella multipartita]|jgi:exonuclease SbcD|nr:exonuclease SbcCD subunit D [Nakamurella multipartita]
MRLLHTSDWHLGRTFHGQNLLPDQEAVLTALADLAAEHRVDAVLISGDLYDRAVPSPEAVQTASRILARIRAAGITVVAIAGNHDSAPRLGAFTDFLAAGGLHLGAAAADVGTPAVLPDPDGDVVIYPIPFLEPDLLRSGWALPAGSGHEAVLARAMDLVRADLAARPPGTRSVVLAHAFVVGGRAGGSERSIAVGGVESVSADLFAGFDYVALGHLHRPQVLADRIRYSGSPLPYSFSEADHEKGVWLVDLDAVGGVSATRLTLPTIRRLVCRRGRLAEILDTEPDLADAYLSVELTDPVRPVDPMRRLREVLPYTLVATWVGGSPAPAAWPAAPAVRTGHDDADLLHDFVRDACGRPASTAERDLLDEALRALRIPA